MPRREILAELQSRDALGLFGDQPQRTLSLTLKLMREEGILVSEGTTKAVVWMRPSSSGDIDG